MRLQIPPSAQHRYDAALGWLGLGNYVEAFNELENLPPEHRASIEVMELRCRIYRKLEKWQELEMLAEGCYASSKGHIDFLCYWAWALMKQGRAEVAEAILEKRKDHRTNNDSEFCFTMACVLGSQQKSGAEKWLLDAFTLSENSDAMKLRALDQPELEGVWSGPDGG